MKIMKFGGTSVGSPAAIKALIDIALAEKKRGPVAVVVSAFSGVTDQLIRIATEAAHGEDGYKALLQTIEERHLSAVKELTPLAHQSAILAQVKVRLNELEDVVRGVALVKEVSPRVMDFVMSFGERLSAFVISAAITARGTPSVFVDSRSLVRTNDEFGSAAVNFKKTNTLIRDFFKKEKRVGVVTGFIGSTDYDETTTLGRGGSDYTAAIFGAALQAKAIEIWTDVDGVMTADPRKVKSPIVLDAMTYQEAMEMSYFGAKVIHPPTMQPALEKNIPLWIKNTFNPRARGTLIGKKPSAQDHLVTGISSIHSIAMLRVEGSGMVGVPGISMRLFGCLAQKKINVIMISQASSEHSICIAVKPEDALRAQTTINEEFALERNAHRIDEVIIEKDLSVIAVVGEKMRERPGIAGKLFAALGASGVNVVAIAQGSSELNISVVIPQKDEPKALSALHTAFFGGDTQQVNLFLVGTGLIGGTLLKQIAGHSTVHVRGVCTSKKMTVDGVGKLGDVDAFIADMKRLNLPKSIFVDCTASEEVAARYGEVLKAGISIVTPNKKANSGPLRTYKALREAAQKSTVRFLYETNVGAGLPVISTLRDLVATGDVVVKIEAVLSGTLSYIFNTFDGRKPFSEVVKKAKEMGYTEPDPRDDLSGTDVARKLLILAREIGLPLELKDIKVESLVSAAGKKAKSVDEFLRLLKNEDTIFAERQKKAAKKGKALRYIATLAGKKASVSLQEVAVSHPAFALSGSDNIISFTTQRYRTTPLVVKGPGAGAEVTAAGVFADILRIL